MSEKNVFFFFSNNFFPPALSTYKRLFFWDSLVVQWLRLYAPNVGSPGSIPGQTTRAHTPQLRACVAQLKILCVAAKTRLSRTNE